MFDNRGTVKSKDVKSYELNGVVPLVKKPAPGTQTTDAAKPKKFIGKK